jgi:hypothetical protein
MAQWQRPLAGAFPLKVRYLSAFVPTSLCWFELGQNCDIRSIPVRSGFGGALLKKTKSVGASPPTHRIFL